MNKILLSVVFLIGLVLRLTFLDTSPPGFSGDEAQQGYSAYSILKTGKDEWGQFLPLNPRSTGDYKAPLQTYLMVPAIAIFGLNEFAIRLPAAVIGVITILIVYFLTKELFKNSIISLWSAFFIAINPWHIQLSRTAFEGGIGVFLFSLGLLFYLKSKQNLKYLILGAISFGLVLYTYHSFKVFTILFLLGIVVFFKETFSKKKFLFFILVFALFLIPLIINLKLSSTRATDVGIFSSRMIEGYFKNKGTSPLPYNLDRLFDNKLFFVTSEIVNNYLSYYSLYFFFTQSRSDSSYLNFPGFPLLYQIEIIFWIAAIIYLFKRRDKISKLFLLWFMLAPVPAALAQGSMHAHRALTFLPLTPLFSGLGAYLFINWFSEKIKIKKKILVYFLVGFLFVNLLYFLHFYFIKLPKNPSISLRSEYREVFTKLWELQDRYDQIVLTRVFSIPQIFVAFYGKYDPTTYQLASKDWLRYEKSDRLYIDQLQSWNLDKFLFEDMDYNGKDKKRKNALLISTIKDFPDTVKPIYEVRNKRGEVVYWFVSIK